MKNNYFDFCALCFRTNKRGLSRYYCEQHQPNSNLYNSDRSKIKRIIGDRFDKSAGHIDKIRLLSSELDSLTSSPAFLLENTRKVRLNGKLSFEPAFKVIENEYKKAFLKLEKGSFSTSFPERWTSGYLVRLGYCNEETQNFIYGASDTDLFDLIIIVSARYEAYSRLGEYFPDRRKRKKGAQLEQSEKDRLLLLIQSIPSKPNGRICRKALGVAIGSSRYKAARLINKLKQSGDLNGDI